MADDGAVVVRCCVPLLLSYVATLRIARAQRSAKPLPTFEEYRVNEIFTHIPQPPIFVTPEQRMFRTRIREGVEKGWGGTDQRSAGQRAKQAGSELRRPLHRNCLGMWNRLYPDGHEQRRHGRRLRSPFIRRWPPYIANAGVSEFGRRGCRYGMA